ncbi:hypothetical protein [Ureibacillus aquaedulcis]|uniref:Collagen triple helix repeat-containing protein n=1 Tax=Ureibacillus aquaedulcis TaxID=3058421 RepID=A0ABT8GU80_9BACL|nr:hypothetical protein [Ureibacillus sp. BA0131]MDN4494964.1 hypothetical protein [Ureibacillus sp. BA0131]
MSKLYYLSTILLLAFLLVGCNSEGAIDNETSDNINETTDVIEEELGDMQKEDLEDSNTDTQLENEPSDAQQNNGNTGTNGTNGANGTNGDNDTTGNNGNNGNNNDGNTNEEPYVEEGDGVFDQGNNNEQDTTESEETDSAADNR